MRKATRTISGVTPIPVMAKPSRCPGECVYCPSEASVPKSYTMESPAALAARKQDYDPGRQVEARIRILHRMGHPTDKIELIVLGGTFLAYPPQYQYQFIKSCFDALNERESFTLEEAQKLNQMAKHRSVGLCIETRPDWCGPEEVKRMLAFGVTRVELGVQTLDDEIYHLIRRGHTVQEVVDATRLLKDSGFKVYHHWMPGLPGSTPERDLQLFNKLFADQEFRPDGLKIYPTLIVQGTELEGWYQAGRYQPYSGEEMIDLIARSKSQTPKYARISRVMREIPAKFIVAGLKTSSLREEVKQRMRELGLECQCIRCREYGHRSKQGWKIGEPKLRRLDYQASEGREIFLSFEDERETLFAILRMRMPSNDGDMALIRELHVFGPEVPLGTKDSEAAQHKGLGRALLEEAERIALSEFKSGRIAVLSGIGAREYYSESGYRFETPYMVKRI
jgi:elongator complex protein 3